MPKGPAIRIRAAVKLKRPPTASHTDLNYEGASIQHEAVRWCCLGDGTVRLMEPAAAGQVRPRRNGRRPDACRVGWRATGDACARSKRREVGGTHMRAPQPFFSCLRARCCTSRQYQARFSISPRLVYPPACAQWAYHVSPGSAYPSLE